MNFFYSIKSNNILSKLTIPKFKNQNYVDKSNQLFVADINNNKWEISKITTEENNDFYFLNNDQLDNKKIFFIAKDIDLKIIENNNYSKIENINNFTDTSPAYRSNLKIYIENGGFSSYQSEYPFNMICKKGSILSSINSLLNRNADKNYVFIRNIYELPIREKFDIYLIDYNTKKIISKYNALTNYTNSIEIDKKFIKPETFLISSEYIGVPMFVSIKNDHISFEHTHPPHEYILSKDRFEKINKLKKEINEIIKK